MKCATAAPGDPPPTDPGELRSLLLSTRTPAVAEFTGPGGGKPVRYMLRWVSPNLCRDGEAGCWTETANATANGMHYMVTWNVQHMANPNKRTHFEMLCLRLGLMPPQIVTPDLLVEADE